MVHPIDENTIAGNLIACVVEGSIATWKVQTRMQNAVCFDGVATVNAVACHFKVDLF